MFEAVNGMTLDMTGAVARKNYEDHDLPRLLRGLLGVEFLRRAAGIRRPESLSLDHAPGTSLSYLIGLRILDYFGGRNPSELAHSLM